MLFGISKEAKGAIKSINSIFAGCEDQEVKDMVTEKVDTIINDDRAQVFRALDALVGVVGKGNLKLVSYTQQGLFIKLDIVAVYEGEEAYEMDREMRLEQILNPKSKYDMHGQESTLKSRVYDAVYYGVQY